MKDLLRKLDRALRQSDPGLYGRMRVGASPGELDETERALGSPLPAAVRQLYAWRDGQSGKGTFPAHGRSVALGFFLPVAEALACRKRQLDWFEAGWLPLIDGGSGDYLCVDVESGGIVEFQHETGRRPLVFASPEAWLEEVVAGLDRAAAQESAVEVTTPRDYVRAHSEPTRNWQELRSWVRGLKECGSPAVFARIALAAARDERPGGPTHPAMARLVESVEQWLADPSTRQHVQEAVAVRNRTFVPAGQVSFAAQQAAEAALTDSLDRACDCALHALAKAAPGIVDGGADSEKSCLELQRRLQAALSSKAQY